MLVTQNSTQHRTQLYLPKSLYNRIKIKSQQEDVSMAKFIRKVLSKEFKVDTQSKAKVWDTFLSASGIGKGPKNLSTQHDRYFSATNK